MAQVSISEAARLAGCTRANLYKSYINRGKLSVGHDHMGKPRVDTAELLRVFGSLQGDNTSVFTDSQNLTAEKLPVHTERDSVIDLLREQVRDARKEFAEREQWYRQQLEAQNRQITDLTSAVKLLEHQRPTPFWQKWFR